MWLMSGKNLIENIFVEIGSDQTSLHNPWAGGYYPAGLSYEESNQFDG
jgi:urocanate hydratase